MVLHYYISSSSLFHVKTPGEEAFTNMVDYLAGPHVQRVTVRCLADWRDARWAGDQELKINSKFPLNITFGILNQDFFNSDQNHSGCSRRLVGQVKRSRGGEGESGLGVNGMCEEESEAGRQGRRSLAGS